MHADQPRVAYVLKMYPRFSETFILTEILAHEAAGRELEIVSLRLPKDGTFHAELAAVRAPVTYLDYGRVKAEELWDALATARETLPRLRGATRIMDQLLGAEVDDAYQALQLARFVHERGIDHLHAHFGSVATTVARLAAVITGTTYSFTAHAKDIFHDSVDPVDLRTKLADAATVVTVSDFNVRWLRDRYGPDAGRVTRVYNGLDLGRFTFSEPRDRPPLIAGVGRLVEKKGFADLVAACGILADRGVAFRCRIVGDGPLAGTLADQVAAARLSDQVELIGPRPQDDVRALLRESAAFAAPCVVAGDDNRDGLPTVLLEAMAMGTPSVATDVTGIPEVVVQGRTGLAVPQHDPVALADALQRLLADAELRCLLARGARRLVEEEFDTDRQAGRVWEAVTSGARSRPPGAGVAGLPGAAAVTGVAAVGHDTGRPVATADTDRVGEVA